MISKTKKEQIIFERDLAIKWAKRHERYSPLKNPLNKEYYPTCIMSMSDHAMKRFKRALKNKGYSYKDYKLHRNPLIPRQIGVRDLMFIGRDWGLIFAIMIFMGIGLGHFPITNEISPWWKTPKHSTILNEEILKEMWPNADKKIIKAVSSDLSLISDFPKQKLLHFMSQISHETGGGIIMKENMNYPSMSHVMNIFGAGKHSANITKKEAPNYVNNDYYLAERAYGIDNPNGKAKSLGNIMPGDGYVYRGGGFLQTTGRASYERVGKQLGIDLVNKPELIERPEWAFKAAVIEFEQIVPHSVLNNDDPTRVTQYVNGGQIGAKSREIWFEKWKKVIYSEPADNLNVFIPGWKQQDEYNKGLKHIEKLQKENKIIRKANK